MERIKFIVVLMFIGYGIITIFTPKLEVKCFGATYSSTTGELLTTGCIIIDKETGNESYPR